MTSINYKIVQQQGEERKIVGYGVGASSIADTTNPATITVTPKKLDSNTPLDAGFYTVYVWRQKNNSINSHEASQPQYFTMGVQPAAPPAIESSIITRTDTSISFTPISGVEYTVDNWATKNTTGSFTGLTGNTSYTLQARVAAVTGVTPVGVDQTQTVTTKKTIAAPTVSGTGGTVTADRTYANAGETVTCTLNSTDATTADKIVINSMDHTGLAGGNSKTKIYAYTVQAGDISPISAVAHFRIKAVASISNPAVVNLFANDTNNNSAAALKAYLDSNIKVPATYDNGTIGESSAVYTLNTGTWDTKGGGYIYTATANGHTATLTVNVKPVNAAITGVGNKMIMVEPSIGYSTLTDLKLPANVPLTYTDDGFTSYTDTLPVSWSSIPSDFGKTIPDSNMFTGTVTLPVWATGSNTTTSTVEITNEIPIPVEGITIQTREYDGAHLRPF